jgi:hypothetical protein
MQMQNNHPKSEKPALKERAAEAKDKNGRQQSTAREQPGKSHGGNAQGVTDDSNRAIPPANKRQS